MRTRFAVHIIASCFTLCWGSAILRAEDPPAAPAKPAAPKTLAELEQEYKAVSEGKKVGSSFKVLGEIWAVDPARIPGELPDRVNRAAYSKMSHTYLPELLQPAAADCVPVLIKMLQSDDKAQHYPATAGLGTILNTARPALEELVPAGPTRVRSEAIRLLGYNSGGNMAPPVASTVAKLKVVLTDPEPALQVEAALSLLRHTANEPAAIKTLEQNFPALGERIMTDVLRGTAAPEAFRSILTLALQQKENRQWRIESALLLAGLDKKLSPPVQAALLEGLSKQQSDSYKLAEKCAANLTLPSADVKPIIDGLTRVCNDGNTTLDIAAAAAATLIQLDPEHAPAYVPHLLTYIARPRYRAEKGKYLSLIGKLGKRSGAAAALAEMLPREGGTCDQLMAIVLLNIDPEHPEAAHDFLREALAGKRKTGSIGMNQLQDPRMNCAPLLPEFVAAIESDDEKRRDAAFDLLRFGGASAAAALPALEKRLGTLGKSEEAALQSVIEKIKAAQP